MSEAEGDRILLVFAKRPEPGEVKTRLAQDVGRLKAAEIYRRMAECVWAGTASDRYRRWLVFEPPEQRSAMEKWLPDADAYVAQADGDLGERLRNAFWMGFQAGARAVAVIATDAPQVTSADVITAFEKLSAPCRSAIGPCPDGGYWLLALSEFRDHVFRDIRWSSPDVFAQTMLKLQADGDVPGVLRAIRDVDRLSDLRELGPSWDFLVGNLENAANDGERRNE